jgi:hypothetical protein
LLPILEAGKSKIKMAADSVSGGSSLLHRKHLLDVFSHRGRARQIPEAFFLRELMPFTRVKP